MIGGRCQLCGRHKAAKRDGGLVLHYVAGVPCLGAGAPPIELDDAHLAGMVDELELERRELLRAIVAKRRELEALLERRANYIPPELEAAIAQLGRRDDVAFRQLDRLGRRLRRHRSWPARFAREMERDGYGSPPPAYLAARQLDADRNRVTF